MKWRYWRITVFSQTAQQLVPESRKAVSKMLFPDDSMSCVREIDPDKIENELARLGWEGWELVSHTQMLEYAGTLVPTHEVYTLKKQEPED